MEKNKKFCGGITTDHNPQNADTVKGICIYTDQKVELDTSYAIYFGNSIEEVEQQLPDYSQCPYNTAIIRL